MTTTPLPAASPSSLTTQLGPKRSSASSSLAGLSTISLCAVLHTGGSHDVLGERLRTLDARGVGRRAEAGDTCCADGVRDAEHQRDLGSDHDEVGVELLRQRGDRLSGRDVDGVLLGDLADPGIARRADQGSDTWIASEGEKEGMFTGSGADNEYAHGCQPTGRAERDVRSVRSRQSYRFALPYF